MTFLPIHAAGRHASAAVGSGAAVIDRVVSSYTPTVRILADSLGRPAGRARRHSQLVVALPATPDLDPLVGAAEEATVVTDYEPTARVLIGPQATRAAVLAALPRHTRLHFAGHGVQYLTRLANAGLIPHDHVDSGWITISDIGKLDLHDAELAFLNACETALGDLNLADESAHLAGALQTAGFRHVVAASWTVRDLAAKRVAQAFYDGLTRLDPALALHRAIRRERDWWQSGSDAGREFAAAQWAPFVHFGP